MKKQVPFKKEINFDTNISEINSISLEHSVSEQKDNLISGKFTVSGDYKITEASIHLDTFEYELPFNINIDKKYNIDSCEIDISDFYYEILNNKILLVNIELTVDNIEEKKEEPIMNNEVYETQEETIEEEIIEEEREEKETINVKSVFNGMDENDNYIIYKIHIVTENDTIESLCNDYMVTKESLESYNNLNDIKIGHKLIIPANENQ